MAAGARILAVDDGAEWLSALEDLLVLNGYQVTTARSGREALSKIESDYPDLVLMDVTMPELTGIEVVKKLKADPVLRFIPVALVTSHDGLADVQAGFAAGADDYIKKPFHKEELLARVQALLRMRGLYQQLERAEDLTRTLQGQFVERHQLDQLMGRSAPMQSLYSLIEKVAQSDVSVLITGESGTGKELAAQAIHCLSRRAKAALCGAKLFGLSGDAFRVGLFGHVRGAFTGAVRDKIGLFEAADGGSFFFDELGEMSPSVQAKLLRLLQNGEFTAVGATKGKRCDVRVIAATNANLWNLVGQGKFREDLYYRLSVISIELPPLRNRRSDIPLLIEHFLDRIAKRSGCARRAIRGETLQLLVDYSWPGNVRELQNEIERLVVLASEGEELPSSLVSERIRRGAAQSDPGSMEEIPEQSLEAAVSALERRMIQKTLEQTNGNKSEAARILGISRSSLISKVKSFG